MYNAAKDATTIDIISNRISARILLMGIFKKFCFIFLLPSRHIKIIIIHFIVPRREVKSNFRVRIHKKLRNPHCSRGNEDFILQSYILFTLTDKTLLKFLFCKCIYMFEKIIFKLIQPK